jgi:TolB protein
MKRRGFSLAEVLLSLAALATILVMAVGVLHFSLYSGRRGDHALRGTLLAQEKLAQAARAPLEDLKPGAFLAPWDGYRFKFEQAPVAAGVVRLTVIVEGPAGSRARLGLQRRERPRDVVLTVRDGDHWRLARVHEEGGPRRLLPSTGGDDSQPTVSPDGKTIVFVSSQGGLGLWSMPADGSAPPQRCPGVPVGASAPAFSPGGQEVAFVCSDADAVSQLFQWTVGGSSQQLTHGQVNVSAPAWGTRLMVALESNALAWLDGAGTPDVVVSGEGWNSSPALSPDGEWVAFMSNRDGSPEIYRMHPDGSQLERLTQNPGYDVHPRWSADSRRLVFQAQRAGVQRVWTMNADGTDQRVLGRPDDEKSPAGTSPEGDPAFL